MKTDEQVLKEWMEDQITFKIGTRKVFTQYEFAAVVDTLCNKRLTDIDSYNVKKGKFKMAVRASNLTLRMDHAPNSTSFPKLAYLHAALKAAENKCLRDPRKIARFESASELYDYLQNKDIKDGIVRVQIPITLPRPAELIKVSVVVAKPRKRKK
jgi:hypothetical protein